LRCRYCNKAISLLRRLNDSEYCSDAHRFDDAAEQQLAMQRLAETQPAMQRTQRMAAAKPGRLGAQAAVVPSGTMSAKAGHLPFTPPALEGGWRPHAVPETLDCGSTVLFADRDHRFRAGMAWGGNTVPVSAVIAGQPFRAPAMQGPVSKARIVTPRNLSSQFARRQTWSAALTTALSSVVLVSKSPGTTALKSPSSEPVIELKRVPHSHRRHERELRPVTRLSRLSMAASGERPTPGKTSGDPADSPYFTLESAKIPVSRLMALAPPIPVRKSDAEEFWALLEASPLGPLMAATSYSRIAPVAPGLWEAAVGTEPQGISFAGLAAILPAFAEPSAQRRPDGSPGLQTVPAPEQVSVPRSGMCSAAVLPANAPRMFPGLLGGLSGRVLHVPNTVFRIAPPQLASLLAANGGHHSVETPVSPRIDLPVRTNFRSTGLSIPSSENILAIAAPGISTGRRFVPIQGVLTSGELTRRIPATEFAERTAQLITASGLPVHAPRTAGAVARGAAVAEWLEPAIACHRPSIRVAEILYRAPRLFKASVRPVHAPRTAGAEPRCRDAANWTDPAIPCSPPSIRTAAVGEGVSLAGRVACELCPDQADSARPPHSLQTLQTVLRVRFPRLLTRHIGKHGGAECVPVNQPQHPQIPWRAAIVSGTDLSPEQVFPLRANQLRPCGLRQLPVQLFAVPRARPMARPANGKPLSLGMDRWASPPAICVSKLGFDDGKPRTKQTSANQFGKELRERLSVAGLHGAWQKINRLPSDLKWIAMVVPLILGIWVLARPAASEPANARISVPLKEGMETESAPAGEGESSAAVTPVSAPHVPEKKTDSNARNAPRQLAPAAEPGRWEILTARIANRASVDLIEDFRNGLSQWEGRGEWARSWSYDRSGTVRPGQMAIFQPTLALKDYVLDIKASIDRRSIQWLVRASNAQNYHFARLNVTPGAPLTKLELERWSVINGKTGRVTRLPLPHGGANQTLYSIRVEVRGDSITTYLQDQVIDTFSDPRLQEGGVGLIGGREDRPRIYGIHVSHQNDFLGKLCSFLAPPPINSQGSD